jgi:hypothetical protein
MVKFPVNQAFFKENQLASLFLLSAITLKAEADSINSLQSPFLVIVTPGLGIGSGTLLSGGYK